MPITADAASRHLVHDERQSMIQSRAEWQEDLLQELDDLVDELEDIEAAKDFQESIKEKGDSMRVFYEDKGSLTEGQLTALENMISEAQRWLHTGENPDLS